jgi:GGDEF domain-containing protein
MTPNSHGGPHWLGGDEFAVVLERLSNETLHESVMRRFLLKVSEPTDSGI